MTDYRNDELMVDEDFEAPGEFEASDTESATEAEVDLFGDFLPANNAADEPATGFRAMLPQAAGINRRVVMGGLGVVGLLATFALFSMVESPDQKRAEQIAETEVRPADEAQASFLDARPSAEDVEAVDVGTIPPPVGGDLEVPPAPDEAVVGPGGRDYAAVGKGEDGVDLPPAAGEKAGAPAGSAEQAQAEQARQSQYLEALKASPIKESAYAAQYRAMTSGASGAAPGGGSASVGASDATPPIVEDSREAQMQRMAEQAMELQQRQLEMQMQQQAAGVAPGGAVPAGAVVAPRPGRPDTVAPPPVRLTPRGPVPAAPVRRNPR